MNRVDAANALGRIGDIRAVEPLIEALKDEDKEVRMEAADALGLIGDTRAIDPLQQLLEDESGVRNHAANAIKKIRKNPNKFPESSSPKSPSTKQTPQKTRNKSSSSDLIECKNCGLKNRPRTNCIKCGHPLTIT